MISPGIHNPTRYRFEIRQLVHKHEAGGHTLAPIVECPLCAEAKGLAVPLVALRVLQSVTEHREPEVKHDAARCLLPAAECATAHRPARRTAHDSPIIAGVEHGRLRCADAREGRQS